MLAARVAAVDTLAALAEVAHRAGYCRPDVDDSGVIDLADARHPVVERLAAAGASSPTTSAWIQRREQVLIVSGPNMAGKSTLIRQVALAVIQAQMGGFVAARAARASASATACSRAWAPATTWRAASRRSWSRCARPRRSSATPPARSLIVLDEIGRGTSTYDGVSIAWAVAEHIHDRVGAKTLFATHYHELGALARAARAGAQRVASRRANGRERWSSCAS